MRINRILPFLLLLFLFCSCKEEQNPVSVKDEQGTLTSNEQLLISELNKYITPCKTTLPDADKSDLKVFDIFANAKVLGLGEATHGTKEFFRMKHRIFKYFVENHQFKIFGFEADMGECLYIDRFICNDIGTIDEAMKKMHFWTWRTQEVKELILWMKQFNEGKSDADKIHLLGVDCQLKTYNKDLIQNYLQKHSGGYPNYIQSIIEDVDKITNEEIESLNLIQFEKLKARCDSVTSFFDENSNHLISSSGKFEFELIKRLTIQTKQFLDVVISINYGYRDKYMAENTIWLTELLGNNTKVVSWAHNGHVGVNDVYLNNGSQGYFLRSFLGNNYKVIGFSFNYGTFRAINYDYANKKYTGLMIHENNTLPPRESSNFIFNYANPQDFILLIENSNNSTVLSNWLNAQRKIFDIGAVYTNALYNDYFRLINLKASYDALIHFHSTTAAVPY